MKNIKKYIAGLGLAAVTTTLFVACEKTFDDKLPVNSDMSNSSVVQVYNAIVNSNRTHIFVEGNRVTGANMTPGSIFPSSGYGFQVAGGLRAFLVRDTLSTTTQIPLSFAENMKAASHQTIFLYDTITAPKQKTVVDNIVIPSDTTARVRFANFPYNPVTVPPTLDVYSARRQANIFTNVAYTEVTEFIPIASGVPDTFYIRPAGTTANLQTVSIPTPPAVPVWSDMRIIFTPTMKRSYTVVFRGSFRTTNVASAHVRTLSLFANY